MCRKVLFIIRWTKFTKFYRYKNGQGLQYIGSNVTKIILNGVNICSNVTCALENGSSMDL